MDELQRLRERIAELEAENAELRRRLAQLEHQLQKIHQRRKRRTLRRTPRPAPIAAARSTASTPVPSDPSRRPAPSSSNTTSIPSSVRIAAPPTSKRPSSSKTTSWPTSPNPRSSGIATAATSPLPLLPAHLPGPRRPGTARRPHRAARPLADLLRPRPPRHLPGQDPRPAPRLLRPDDQPGRPARSPALGRTLFAPVVEELLELLRQSPVVPGDETGWRINGQAGLGLVLPRPPPGPVPHRPPPQPRRPRARLGESFAGTLVSDFYAAYNGLDCPKQRCLVHLLRELAKLREELPWQVGAGVHPAAHRPVPGRHPVGQGPGQAGPRGVCPGPSRHPRSVRRPDADAARVIPSVCGSGGGCSGIATSCSPSWTTRGAGRQQRQRAGHPQPGGGPQRRRHAPSRLERGGVRPAQERDRHRA